MTLRPVFSEGLFTLRNLRSMGAAAILEAMIACGIAALLIWQQLRPEITQPPPIGDPVTHFTEATFPQPHQRTVTEPQSPQSQPLHEVPAVPTDLPTATTQPVRPPQGALDPSDGAGSADILAAFEARMTSAIDAAKVYPKIALLNGEQGVVTVSFDYIDGVVSDVHVEKSSGYHSIDDSAIKAVLRAALPPKPAEVVGQDRFAVTLDYTLGN